MPGTLKELIQLVIDTIRRGLGGLIGILVLLVFLAFLFTFNQGQEEPGACPAFTESPLPLNNVDGVLSSPDISAIVPLGNVQPPSHVFPSPHIYFHLQGGGASSVPLYSPVDAEVVKIERKTFPSGQGPGVDYSIEFKPCETFTGYFHHVTSLSGDLEQAFNDYLSGGECPDTSENCLLMDPGVSIAAGVQIGTVGGNADAESFDLGVRDFAAPPISVVNPASYDEWYLHTACPLDYFEDSLQQHFNDLLANEWGTQSASATPKCWTVEQDLLGTAQGVWFTPDAQFYIEDQHLSLVHYNIDPNKGILSVGGKDQQNPALPGGEYYFAASQDADASVNRDFNLISVSDGGGPSTVQCYQGLTKEWGDIWADTVFLLQLMDANTLRIEKRAAGTCASLGDWSLENYTEFSRIR